MFVLASSSDPSISWGHTERALPHGCSPSFNKAHLPLKVLAFAHAIRPNSQMRMAALCYSTGRVTDACSCVTMQERSDVTATENANNVQSSSNLIGNPMYSMNECLIRLR